MISVLMCVYKEKLEWLRQAVESVTSQTYRDIEFLVVIDNPDLDPECLAYLKRKAHEDGRIRLHFNKTNLGLMHSLNTGIGLVRGEYIARMDADDISFEQRLEKELAFLEKGNWDMVSSNRINIDEQGREAGRPSLKGKVPARHLPYSNFIVHPSVLIKTSVLKELGGYRPFANTEDYDLWLRMLSYGYSIGILDEPLLYYRIRSTSNSHKNSLETYWIARYQQQLYWQRLKTGEDSFTAKNYENYMAQKDMGPKANQKYRRFRCWMDGALEGMKEKNPTCACKLALAFVTDPGKAAWTLKDLVRKSLPLF